MVTHRVRTLVISDLHLAEDRPATTQRFARFLDETVPGADALYILGDLFEYWVGDDGLALDFPARIAALLGPVAREVPTFFMHGNRDFLIAADFSRHTGIALLEDPTVVLRDNGASRVCTLTFQCIELTKPGDTAIITFAGGKYTIQKSSTPPWTFACGAAAGLCNTTQYADASPVITPETRMASGIEEKTALRARSGRLR